MLQNTASYLKTKYSQIPDYFKEVFGLFLVTRALTYIIITISRILYAEDNGLDISLTIHKTWSLWDQGWYMRIIEQGYDNVIASSGPTVGQATYAFFPVYPMSAGLLDVVIQNSMYSGLIISNLALLIAMIYLYKLVRLDSDRDTSILSVKYALIFPTAFVFSAIFSESMFLMLMLVALYYARKQRWVIALVAAGLLTATRLVGAVVLVAMFLEYLHVNKFTFGFSDIQNNLKKLFRPNILTLPLAFCGLGLFVWHIYTITGEYDSIFTIQAAWDREPINPFVAMYTHMGVHVSALFGSMVTIGTFLVVLVSARYMRFSYVVMSALMILVPLSTSSTAFHMTSMPRYLVVIFPLYLICARLATQHKYYDQLLTISIAMIQSFVMIQWALGFGLVA